jgi:hypothetical protein
MATSPKKKPPAKKAPAPAKDLKPGDSRSSYLNKKAPKASSGTLTERMGEVKNRPNKGLPARTGQSRGNLNKANPPKEIRLGGQGGTGRSITKAGYLDKFKPIPLGDRPKLLAGPARKAASGIGGTLARGAFRAVGGPLAMLISMTTEAGQGSDKPSGPLFSPSKNRAAGKGNPKAVNPYKLATARARIPAKGEARGGMKYTLESYRASKAAGKGNPKTVNPYKAPVSMAGGGVNKPEAKAKDFKEKNLAANQKVGKKDKPAAPVKRKAPAFKGNWTGAAPTEMQKRGGQKIMRPNLLDLIRRKKK